MKKVLDNCEEDYDNTLTHVPESGGLKQSWLPEPLGGSPAAAEL